MSHLFAPTAGFPFARQRQRSILVRDETGRVDVAAVISRWNAAAGWQLFAAAPTGAVPDVTFQATSGSRTWVKCNPSHKDPYTSVVIYLVRGQDDTHTLTHELSHALGFADHIDAGTDATPYVNPGHCPDDGYHGVESYCDWNDEREWFGSQDLRMLEQAGYRVATPPPPTPIPGRSGLLGLIGRLLARLRGGR